MPDKVEKDDPVAVVMISPVGALVEKAAQVTSALVRCSQLWCKK